MVYKVSRIHIASHIGIVQQCTLFIDSNAIAKVIGIIRLVRFFFYYSVVFFSFSFCFPQDDHKTFSLWLLQRKRKENLFLLFVSFYSIFVFFFFYILYVLLLFVPRFLLRFNCSVCLRTCHSYSNDIFFCFVFSFRFSFLVTWFVNKRSADAHC